MMGIKAKSVALGGIISALCVVVLFLGGMVNLTLVAPIAAGVFIMLMAVETGNKSALCAWVAVSVLALLIIPNRGLGLHFALLYGYYPVAKQGLERLPGKLLEYAVKLLIFIASSLAAILILIFVFGAHVAVGGIFGQLAPNLNPWLFVMLSNVVVGSFAGFYNDWLLTYVYKLYIDRYRPKLFGGAKWGS